MEGGREGSKQDKEGRGGREEEGGSCERGEEGEREGERGSTYHTVSSPKSDSS